MRRAMHRLAAGLLATAAFVVVPAASASADPIPKDLTWVYDDIAPGCEPWCGFGEVCVGHDENLAGRICVVYGDVPLISYVMAVAEQVAGEEPPAP